VYFTN